MPSRSSSSSKSSASASAAPARIRARADARRGLPLRWPRATAVRSHGKESRLVCDSQKALTTSTPLRRGPRRDFANKTALADPGWPTSPTTAPWPSIAPSSSLRRRTSPTAGRPMPSRLAGPPDAVSPCPAAARRDRFVSTLDLHQFRLAEISGAVDESRGGRAEHYPAGRRGRLHPLRHADLFTDGGVTESAGTYFAGDDLTGVEPDPHLEVDAVALPDLDRKPLRFLLDANAASRPGRRGPPAPPARRTPPSGRHR